MAAPTLFQIKNAFRFSDSRKAERGLDCALALRIIVVKSNVGVHKQPKLKAVKNNTG
jgi:hypothetical protein